MAQCKDCESPVTWAEGPNGRMLPFDEPPPVVLGKRKPLPTGLTIWSIVGGFARRATTEDTRLHRELVTCHFDTCSERGPR